MSGEKTITNSKVVVDNRRARHEYELTEHVTCGIMLVGSEARSIRDGNVSIAEAYCFINNGELFVRGMRIEPYKMTALGKEHNPDRDKKLLLKKREIERFDGRMAGTGLTLIPLALLLTGGMFKLRIALAKGRKKYDKRQVEKNKAARREMREVV